MGKPKNARNVKVGDSVILKKYNLKNLNDNSSSELDFTTIFKNRAMNHIDDKPIVLSAFHISEDASKILKVIEVDTKRGIPVARVKVKSKNNNPWSENFSQIVALEDLLKV